MESRKKVSGVDDEDGDKSLSKNQLKKRRRYEMILKKNKRRKEQTREAKIAKAKAEGRDLDMERREQEERTRSGVGHKRREELWVTRMKNADNSFKVCIDCSYDEYMSSKEIGSLCQQVRYCYSVNKNSPNPVYLSLSSVSGEMYDNLSKVCGFPDQWLGRAFSFSEKSVIEMHPNKSNIVYLTSDSENTLDQLDDNKVYIIGGIVDRNRHKGMSAKNAIKLGIQTAKLPIDEHPQLLLTKVLTCNHVFEILLKYQQNKNNWKEALQDVVPRRKAINQNLQETK